MAEATTLGREVLSVEEAAEFLGVGRTYMYALLASGEVNSLKIGRLRKVRRRDLDAYLDRLAAEQA